MKCLRCGKENADHLFYCGECSAELPRPGKPPPGVEPWRPPSPPPATQTVQSKTEVQVAAEAPDPLVAIAINVRRIFLVLLLTMVVSIFGSSITYIAMILLTRDGDISAVTAVAFVWLGLMICLMIAGVIYIVTSKRVTLPRK